MRVSYTFGLESPAEMKTPPPLLCPCSVAPGASICRDSRVISSHSSVPIAPISRHVKHMEGYVIMTYVCVRHVRREHCKVRRHRLCASNNTYTHVHTLTTKDVKHLDENVIMIYVCVRHVMYENCNVHTSDDASQTTQTGFKRRVQLHAHTSTTEDDAGNTQDNGSCRCQHTVVRHNVC